MTRTEFPRITIEEYADKLYKVKNGTFFNIETEDKIVDLLESMRVSQQRVILRYGDTETGRIWGDGCEPRTVGRISRSMGPVKAPILINNRRSMGGECILDSSIVEIRYSQGKELIYRHPNLHPTPDGWDKWMTDIHTLMPVKHKACVAAYGGAFLEEMFDRGASPEEAMREYVARQEQEDCAS